MFSPFWRKGCNGKTTSACATVLHLAREKPQQKVLIVSTDPAHSLNEIFNTPVGEAVVPIVAEMNLFGIEINAERLWEDFKRNYRKSINALFSGFGGVEVRFDREPLEELVSARPPDLNQLGSKLYA